MKTQHDGMNRVVALENLTAMCKHVSGTCHRYWIESVSRSRVTVGYSNPNEYGSESPMFAVFPCFPNPFDTDGSNPFVMLTGVGSLLRIVNDTWSGEGWQAFEILRECPVMFRGTSDAGDTWKAHPEEETIDAIARAHMALADALPQSHDFHLRVTMRAKIVAESDGGTWTLNPRDNREAIAGAIQANLEAIRPKY